ncbi:hypothetical protein [Youngiibacter fragilis]|uniref:Uncharacterized protein n=1 Tax=Youngiibacter fragilis 232.1 TaxID=994573 RepID=V7I8L3_9CLOT|nr:hypothetical protein [Youngiibacter fragilis]ETA82193.1 hypothetical protein T472_0202315 [Youngiibacter fragilis 232.1]
MENKKVQLTEVWGDTVDLKELMIASLLGIALTMSMFLIGRNIFLRIEGLDPGLAKGYSLLIGIVGCIASGVISAKLFKPKRIVEEKFENEDIEEILKAAGMTVEDEINALRNVDPAIIAEMEEFELYSLLELVPEDSPNYKPEYKEKAKGGK